MTLQIVDESSDEFDGCDECEVGIESEGGDECEGSDE